MNFIERFNRISDLVEENIEKDEGTITEIICNTFTVEKRRMAYAFEFIVGYSLPKYIRRRKLCRAFHEKEESGCGWDNVLEIAGYSERSSFDKAFLREYASSPAQYLGGDRKVELVEPLEIHSMESNFTQQQEYIIEKSSAKAEFEMQSEDDIDLMNNYLNFQALYGLSLSQIVLAKSLCSEMSCGMYEVCSTLEREYLDIDPHLFGNFYKDCFYVSVKLRYSREMAEYVITMIRKNTLLDIRQLDANYIIMIAMLKNLKNEESRNKLFQNLTYDNYLKLKDIYDPNAIDADFSFLCFVLGKDYSLEELNDIMEHLEERDFEKTVWYLGYRINQERESAELLIRILKDAGYENIREMDREYLWFIVEKAEKEDWAQLVKKAPYEEFVRLKERIKRSRMEDYYINEIIGMVLDDGIEFEKAFEIESDMLLNQAIKAWRDEYVLMHSGRYNTADEFMEVLDTYFPNKIPMMAFWPMNVADIGFVENLIEENPEIWDLMSPREMFEMDLYAYSDASFEECREILKSQMEADGIYGDVFDINYMDLNVGYVSMLCDELEEKWDRKLIPYAMCKEIYEFAESHPGKHTYFPDDELARVARSLLTKECATVEEAFRKISYSSL